MVVGLLHSGRIRLTSWVPYVHSRAKYAQSTQRRFHRWLSNERIDVHALYAPLLQQALTEWGEHVLYVALDTSQLEDGYCLIRLSVIFRGPIMWDVLQHGSAMVSFQTYEPLLEAAAKRLPTGVKVVLLAELRRTSWTTSPMDSSWRILNSTRPKNLKGAAWSWPWQLCTWFARESRWCKLANAGWSTPIGFVAAVT